MFSIKVHKLNFRDTEETNAKNETVLDENRVKRWFSNHSTTDNRNHEKKN